MPVSTSHATDDSRREFLGHCATALQVVAIGSVLAPLASCGASRVATRDLGGNRIEANVAMLTTDGASAVLDRNGPDGRGILVVRASAASYIAMSMNCTHKGCEVEPPTSSGIIVCACHNSQFDLTGAVVKAPAKAPLKRYATTVSGDTVTITLA